jgi:hypothetical protein
MYYLLSATANVCARGFNCYLFKIPTDKAVIFNGVDLATQVASYYVFNHLLHQFYVQAAPVSRQKGRYLEAELVSLVGSTLVGLVAGVFAARHMQVNPLAVSITSSMSGVVGACVVILLKEAQVL